MPTSKIQEFRYSAIVPVYNSANVVGQTIDRIVNSFEKQRLDGEVILVNDGSRDGSWNILERRARSDNRVMAIDLIENYGQHTAIFCGLKYCTGDYAITLDDDLQNAPEEMIHLMEKALEGHDVVFGRFRQKHHAGHRILGSRLIHYFDRRVYGCPRDLVLSNFRIIRRDVIGRMLAYNPHHPYITGLCLRFATHPANILVEHHPRPAGKSSYSFTKLLRLVRRVVSSHWSYPLWILCALGAVVSVPAVILGMVHFFVGRQSGWPIRIAIATLLGGLAIVALGVVCELLLGRVARATGRPTCIIRESINLERLQPPIVQKISG